MIILKHEQILEGLLDPKLIELIALTHEILSNITITSLYRPMSKGVHGTFPVRGVDIRCRNADIGSAVVNYINSDYIYDGKRPEMVCAMFHGDYIQQHLHLQVHPNTRRR